MCFDSWNFKWSEPEVINKTKEVHNMENITVQMGASTRVWEYESL